MMMTTLSTNILKNSRISRLTKSSKHKQTGKANMPSIQTGSDFLTQKRSWRKKGINIDIGGQAG